MMNTRPAINIAIDGPSGAGKSSVCDAAAARYGFRHLDTGAMYRAIALALSKAGIRPQPSPVLDEALANISIHFEGDEIFVNGENVTQMIRQPEVSLLASRYSALEPVRNRLVAAQQAIAKEKGYILDGRDICDVVLPDAELKIYLDAAPEARAKRRMAQNLEKGIESSYDEVLAAIQARDHADRTRKAAPLRVSKDAIVVDSSDLTFDQTVDTICSLIDSALNRN